MSAPTSAADIKWGATAATVSAAESRESRPSVSQATRLVDLARTEGAELWHTPGGDAYVSIHVNGHLEHYPVGSRGCRDYMARLYYVDTGKAPNASALQDAITTLSGIARFGGTEHSVYVRIAGDNDRIYLDLGDPEWRVAEITAAGWQVTSNPPVRFRRPRGVLPLPVPQRGGSIGELRRFLNLASEDDFTLIVSWELAALRPSGPYPILVFMAEQGAAKTTCTRVLRRLCDPNDSDVRRPPRNTEDLMIAAMNGHCVVFDNLSRLSEDLSDNLSVLATGGGFAVRQLYTNTEEQIFNAQKPIILNGISQVATRGDLLDRAIVITLPPILEQHRKDEATFWHDFDAVRPCVLGALLDAVAVGLRRLPHVDLERKPRMADFAMWGVATEPACPWPPGMFLSVYAGNRQEAVEATLDGDPLVKVVRVIAPWRGTASDLLEELNRRTPEAATRHKDWYSRPRQVADHLRRLAPGLRRTGIDVTFKKEGHDRRRIIVLEEVGNKSSPSSAASAGPDWRPNRADESADAGRVASGPWSADSTNFYGCTDDADAEDAERQPSSGDEDDVGRL